MAVSPLTKKIHFFSADRAIPLKSRKRLKAFIVRQLKAEEKSFRRLNIIFCSDRYLLKINQEYLNHHDYTDIITFDFSSEGTGSEGEIYISVDRIKENAGKFHSSMAEEIHRVIFHGVLHFAGYRDTTPKARLIMRGKENLYLKKYSQFVSRETRSS
jgi:rRNA maturation RNase YbeY